MTKPVQGEDAFYYDPDYRHTNAHPKDPSKPYCLRCQHNVDVKKAVAVTANEENWTALVGHNRQDELRMPGQRADMVTNSYLGKDCYRKLRTA